MDRNDEPESVNFVDVHNVFFSCLQEINTEWLVFLTFLYIRENHIFQQIGQCLTKLQYVRWMFYIHIQNKYYTNIVHVHRTYIHVQNSTYVSIMCTNSPQNICLLWKQPYTETVIIWFFTAVSKKKKIISQIAKQIEHISDVLLSYAQACWDLRNKWKMSSLLQNVKRKKQLKRIKYLWLT
jgi:hypothetical protein